MKSQWATPLSDVDNDAMDFLFEQKPSGQCRYLETLTRPILYRAVNCDGGGRR